MKKKSLMSLRASKASEAISLFVTILFLLFTSSVDAATIHVRGKHIRGEGKTPNRLIADEFIIPVGGAAIKKVRNSSKAGFVIEGEGGVLLYKNTGESAVGIRLGPGRYCVYPYLQPGHREDTVRLELEPQKTGEWVTKGGRQNIQKFQPR